MLQELGFHKYAGIFSKLFKKAPSLGKPKDFVQRSVLNERRSVKNLGLMGRKSLNPTQRKLMGQAWAKYDGEMSVSQIEATLGEKIRRLGTDRRAFKNDTI